MRSRPSASRARGLRTFERLELRAMLAADVIINELMYHPSSADIGEEYIELFNRATGPAGSDTANLAGWKFDSGIDFTFSSGSLAPGQYLVVAANLAKFAAWPKVYSNERVTLYEVPPATASVTPTPAAAAAR